MESRTPKTVRFLPLFLPLSSVSYFGKHASEGTDEHSRKWTRFCLLTEPHCCTTTKGGLFAYKKSIPPPLTLREEGGGRMSPFNAQPFSVSGKHDIVCSSPHPLIPFSPSSSFNPTFSSVSLCLSADLFFPPGVSTTAMVAFCTFHVSLSMNKMRRRSVISASYVLLLLLPYPPLSNQFPTKKTGRGGGLLYPCAYTIPLLFSGTFSWQRISR